MAAENVIGGAFVDIAAPLTEFKSDLVKARGSFIEFAADITGITKALGQVLVGLGGALTAGVTVPIAIVGTKTVGLATKADQAMLQIRRAFGSSIGVVEDWAERFAKSLNLSSFEMLRLAGRTQAILVSLGLGQKEATDFSTALSQLATDMAATRDASPGDVLNSLIAGITGGTQAVRKFGADISDNTVKQLALKLGITQTFASLDFQTKAMLRASAILMAFGNEIGNAGRKSEMLAGISLSLDQQVRTVSIAIGRILTPIVRASTFALSQMLRPIVGLIDLLAKLPRPILFAVGGFVALAAAMGPLVIVTAGVTLAIIKWSSVITIAKLAARGLTLAVSQLSKVQIINTAITRITAAATWIWNLALIAVKTTIRGVLLLLGVLGIVLIAVGAIFEAFFGRTADAANMDEQLKKIDEALGGIKDSASGAAGGFRELGSIGTQVFRRLRAEALQGAGFGAGAASSGATGGVESLSGADMASAIAPAFAPVAAQSGGGSSGDGAVIAELRGIRIDLQDMSREIGNGLVEAATLA